MSTTKMNNDAVPAGESGMQGLGYDQTQKRILHTKAYATVERLYRCNGRFYFSRESWWSHKNGRQILFFDRTGDSEGEKFEEMTESEVSHWLKESEGCGDMEFLADEIADVDQKEALTGQEPANPSAPKIDETDGCGCCWASSPKTCCGLPRQCPVSLKAGGKESVLRCEQKEKGLMP